MLGLEPWLANWKDLFGKGSTLVEADAYPPKDELVRAWHAAIDRLVAGVEAASDAALRAPNEYLPSETLPKVADFLTYSMTGHVATHLGQISSWRRAAGRPALF